MQRSKVETFIGFSLRARKLVTGANSVRETKGIKLVFVCNTASKNTFDDALAIAKRNNVPLLFIKNGTAEELTNKANCKVFAITDDALAKAVEENLDENFEVVFKR